MSERANSHGRLAALGLIRKQERRLSADDPFRMQDPLNCHVSRDDLELYAMERASGDLLDTVEEHLLVCEHCRRSLDEVEQELRLLRVCLREAEVHSRPV